MVAGLGRGSDWKTKSLGIPLGPVLIFVSIFATLFENLLQRVSNNYIDQGEIMNGLSGKSNIWVLTVFGGALVVLGLLALPASAATSISSAPAAQLHLSVVPVPASMAADARPLLLAQATTECKGCGEVTAVREVEVTGKGGSGVGIGVGAVVGGILGSKVGGGTGRSVATVGGAVAGGVAGNEIEKRVNKDKQYEVVVRMQNGKTRVFRFDQKPHWEAGDLVKVVNGVLNERDE